jgi:putative transposase
VVEGLYHVWFSTKGRKPVLDGEIGVDAKRLLIEIARATRTELIEADAIADHVHLLVRLSGRQTLSSVMHRLKGTSTRHVFLRYPELKLDLGHNSLWQKGYGWRKIAAAEVPAVRNYIRTQVERPLRHDAGDKNGTCPLALPNRS